MKIIFIIFLAVSCFSCSLLHNSKNIKNSSKSVVLQKDKQAERKLARVNPLTAIRTPLVKGTYPNNVSNKNNKTEYQAYITKAKQGDVDAQYNLGVIFYWGRGVTQNYKQAVYWYKLAAHQGNPWAQYNLGEMFYWGQGVARNHSQAIAWYRKAASQNMPEAQYALGMKYYYGEGVAQNYAKAIDLFQKAVRQGLPQAKYYSIHNNTNNPKNTSTKTFFDSKEYWEWYKEKAREGFAWAQHTVEKVYAKGKGAMPKPKQVLYWIGQAASQNIPEAQYYIGVIMENNTPPNIKKAMVSYKNAAQHGHAAAQHRIKESNITTQDQEETFETYLSFGQ